MKDRVRLAIGSLCCATLLLVACGGEVEEPPLEPGTMRGADVPASAATRRTTWNCRYRLPEDAPPEVTAHWRVMFVEDGNRSKARDVGSAGKHRVTSEGTLTFSYGEASDGGQEFGIRFSHLGDPTFLVPVPTAELMRHQDGDVTVLGGGVVMSVAPETIALGEDIPLAVHALWVKGDGSGGHVRATLEETIEVHDRVIALVLRFTAE